MDNDAKAADSFFVLDKESGTHETYTDRASFEGRAREIGVAPNLKPIDVVYGPQMVGFVLLATWVVVVRNRRFEGTSNHPLNRQVAV